MCIIGWVVVLLLLTSCSGFERAGKRLQRTLIEQQEQADIQLEQLCVALQTNNIDSIRHFTQLNNNILMYVFSGRRLVYWTDSWLSSSYLPVRDVYDKWQYGQWNNAQGICKRIKYGNLQVLVVIPIKYDYRVTSTLLHNSFIAPFKGDDNWELSSAESEQENYYPIYSDNGDFLFSIKFKDNIVTDEPIHIENFSYQAILASERHTDMEAKHKLYAYYGIIGLLLAVLMVLAIYGVIKSKGIRKMKLSGKLQLILTSMVIVFLIAIFVLSIVHIRNGFVKTQRQQLQDKARYIQMALQTIYYWDIELSKSNTSALNIDLRDMSFAYETDIHVYDLNGQLLGSSTPQIFDLGILSSHMASEALFTTEHTMVREERIGDVRYLSAYTEFVNGNFNTIGYISVPSFISQEEMNAYVEELLVRLIPLYTILLMISILVVWLIARMVSSPLSAITMHLKNYRLGEKGQHLSYYFEDEVGDLIQHYNEMMDALAESTQKLAQSEREGAWRTMARQVAHEINNPLTPMKLTLQLLQRYKGTERFDEYFDKSTKLLIDQIDNLGYIATSFSSFAKMPEVKPSQVDIAKKLYEFVVLLRNNPDSVPIRYVGPEEGVEVMADAEQITQVFTNIVRNALQAMEGRENSDIIIIMKMVSSQQCAIKGIVEGSKWVEISFSDNGPGIPDEVVEKVFIPNFTTKNTGAGLGLAISKNIVEGSGGMINFTTSDKGTTFYVYLRRV